MMFHTAIFFGGVNYFIKWIIMKTSTKQADLSMALRHMNMSFMQVPVGPYVFRQLTFYSIYMKLPCYG